MAKEDRQHNGQGRQATQWPRKTDNTMAKEERQHNGQGSFLISHLVINFS